MSTSIVAIRDEFDGLPLWGKLVTGAIAVAGPMLMYAYYKKRPRKSPIKENWTRDVVYLYQFPPCATIPNLSPYALKLETWLRMVGINYEHVPCSMTTRSKEGLLPFVELNGSEIADSAFAMRDLAAHFGIMDGLSNEQAAVSRAFRMMMENSTFWSYAYNRYVLNAEVMLSEQVLGFRLPLLFRMFNPSRMFRAAIRTKLWHMGIGRHEEKDIISIGLDDLRAMSSYLGTKQFMHGDAPSEIDCCLFGVLAQILYVPIKAPHRDLLDTECSNLKDYTERIKRKFWPDRKSVV